MKEYSCWNWCHSKRYYLTHPWQWFKDLKRNIKNTYMRARYGFCWIDVWNWDHWFLHTTPNMLRRMAEKGCAYPGHPPFETPEKWHDWLNEMADLLETGTDEWQDAHNEHYKKFNEQYLDRANELEKQGEANVQRVMNALGEHFFDLWD